MQKHLQSPRSGDTVEGCRLLTIPNNIGSTWLTRTPTPLPHSFSTKDRRPLITPEIEPQLYDFIGGIIRGLRGICLELNGTKDLFTC